MFGRRSIQMKFVKDDKVTKKNSPVTESEDAPTAETLQKVAKETAKGVIGLVATYVILDTIRTVADNLTR